MADDDLEFRTYDVATSDPDDAHVAGWAQAVVRGFHDSRLDEEMHGRWRRHAVRDGDTLRGAWPTSPRLADGMLPVATFASWRGEINVGDETRLPLLMITDITVSPTHRRRGLLRRLMTEDLADAVEQGLPLAALTVSEGSIYGRFGFGPATSHASIEVDVSPRFAFRPEARLADGDLALIAPGASAADAVEQVFARFHATTRGSVSRPAFYRDFYEEGFDHESRTQDGKRQLCFVMGDDGPLGYVSYRHEGRPDDQGGRGTVRVRDLVATSPEVHLRLWRFLADLDLVERALWGRASHEDPLAWALTDPRCVRTTGVGDLLWVRVLDVPAALSARPWGADGDEVIGVDDPLGHAHGRFRVVVRDGRAEVRPTDDAATATMAADSLGAAYLGGTSVRTLAAAGRIAGEPDAVARLAAMADVAPPPYCTTGF